ncbi:MAG: hypothetical protein VKO21_04900 [Candidatus Sericytochromatia bacterium]|nr:hypothetical protein [Candidatus Sericytochromatia bacterium]
MTKATFLDLEAYKAEVERLHALLTTRRTTAAQSSSEEGAPPSARKPFADVDLGDELQSLMNVALSTHQEYGGQSVPGITSALRSQARAVTLAALLTLIREEYEGLRPDKTSDFWSLYKEWTGRIPDTRIQSILDKALADEGIVRTDSLDKDGRKGAWYVDALIAASGQPGKLLQDICDLFAIHWKYFHPADIRETLRLMRGTPDEQKRVQILQEDHAKLRELAERFREMPTAIHRAISELGKAVEVVCLREDLTPLDLVDRPEKVEDLSGVHPLRVVRGKVALRRLAERYTNAIGPERFRRILMGLPVGARVVLPNGYQVDPETAADVPFYGRYRTGTSTYNVMPNELLTAEEITQIPEQALGRLGERVLYKSRDEYQPLEGDAESPVPPRELYLEGRSCGYVWWRNRPVDRPVRVAKQDRQPDEGIHGRFVLLHRPDGLHLGIAGLRLHDPRLAGRNLELIPDVPGGVVPVEELPGVTTDRQGNGSQVYAGFQLAAPEAGEVHLHLRQRDSKDTLVIGGQTAAWSLKLPGALLFSIRRGVQLVPGHHPWGEDAMVLYAPVGVPFSAPEGAPFTVQAAGVRGGYACWQITWQDTSKPLHLDFGGGLSWTFDRASTLRLDAKLPEESDAFFKVPVQFGVAARRWEDLTLVLEPAPTASRGSELDLRLHANDAVVTTQNLSMSARLGGVGAGLSQFTGDQVRKAFGLGESASGHFRLEILGDGVVLAEAAFTVLPYLELNDLPTQPFLEGEEISFMVVSRVKCFGDDAVRRRVALPGVQVDPGSLGVGEFVPPAVVAHVPLERPRLNLEAHFEVPVCGWRLFDDAAEGDDPGAAFQRKVVIGRDDLARFGLVLFTNLGQTGGLILGDQVVRSVPFYEGYAFVSLSELTERITSRATKLVPFVGERRLTPLTVTWAPRVTAFEASVAYVQDRKIRLSIAYEGPQGDVIRLQVKAPDGRVLAREDLACEGRAERREHFEIVLTEGLGDLDQVSVVGSIPAIAPDHVFGTLVFRNQARDPDLLEAIATVEHSPGDPIALFARGALYRTKGLVDEAAADFRAALELGLKEPSSLKIVRETLALQDWRQLQVDIQALANIFVPFCRKELRLDY